MTKSNAERQEDFRTLRAKDGIKELRGVYVKKAWHKELKKYINQWVKRKESR